MLEFYKAMMLEVSKKPIKVPFFSFGRVHYSQDPGGVCSSHFSQWMNYEQALMCDYLILMLAFLVFSPFHCVPTLQDRHIFDYWIQNTYNYVHTLFNKDYEMKTIQFYYVRMYFYRVLLSTIISIQIMLIYKMVEFYSDPYFLTWMDKNYVPNIITLFFFFCIIFYMKYYGFLKPYWGPERLGYDLVLRMINLELLDDIIVLEDINKLKIFMTLNWIIIVTPFNIELIYIRNSTAEIIDIEDYKPCIHRPESSNSNEHFQFIYTNYLEKWGQQFVLKFKCKNLKSSETTIKFYKHEYNTFLKNNPNFIIYNPKNFVMDIRTFEEAFQTEVKEFITRNEEIIMDKTEDTECRFCYDKLPNTIVKKKCQFTKCGECKCPPYLCLQCRVIWCQMKNKKRADSPEKHNMNDLYFTCFYCTGTVCIKDVLRIKYIDKEEIEEEKQMS